VAVSAEEYCTPASQRNNGICDGYSRAIREAVVSSVVAGATGVAHQRKLAAILCADVAGFSRLMGEDETATYEALARLRGAIDPLISSHRGRLVSTAGDGLLADFASVVDALSCAVEMQHAAERLNDPVPSGRRIELRIGVNLGDVIVAEDGDLYGDGVNIAARLQTLASPGGICLSQPVYDQVSNKLDLDYRPLGKHRVKNIAMPVSAYAIGPAQSGGTIWRMPRRHATFAMIGILLLLNAGLVLWLLARPAGQQSPVATVDAAPVATLAVPARMAERTSVAVLPFKNLSLDAGQDFLSDGITEDIINALGRFSSLLVAAKSASYQFKGRDLPPAEAGRMLGVRYLVEGSVRRAGDQLRITVELSEAATGFHLWSEVYNAELKDVFAVQDDITRRIASSTSPRQTLPLTNTFCAAIPTPAARPGRPTPRRGRSFSRRSISTPIMPRPMPLSVSRITRRSSRGGPNFPRMTTRGPRRWQRKRCRSTHSPPRPMFCWPLSACTARIMIALWHRSMRHSPSTRAMPNAMGRGAAFCNGQASPQRPCLGWKGRSVWAARTPGYLSILASPNISSRNTAKPSTCSIVPWRMILAGCTG